MVFSALALGPTGGGSFGGELTLNGFVCGNSAEFGGDGDLVGTCWFTGLATGELIFSTGCGTVGDLAFSGGCTRVV